MRTIMVSVCCVLLGILSERMIRVSDEGRVRTGDVVEQRVDGERNARAMAEWSSRASIFN